MKKSIFFLSSFLLLSLTVSAQSLIQGLGGTATNFQITNNDTELEVVGQAISKRGIAFYNEDSESGYGYGYQVYTLEFITKAQIEPQIIPVILNHPDQRYKREAKITFYAADGSILLAEKRREIDMFFWKKRIGGKLDNQYFFYTINLENYPLLLLDRTVKIDFTGVKEIRKKKKKTKKKS